MSWPGKWRLTETKAIRRFAMSKHALDDTAFRLGPNSEYSTNSPWLELVQTDIVESPDFSPSFQFSVDEDLLLSDVQLSVDDLELVLTVADPAMHSTRVIERWPVARIPPHFAPLPSALRAQLSGQRGLVFSVQVTPLRQLEARDGVASDPGQVVAARPFALLPETEGSGFPTRVVDPSEFVRLGLPSDTVWVISWLSVDYEHDPEDVLCILINRQEATKILQMSGSDAVARVLWTEIATEILVEVCATVFGHSADDMLEVPEEETGFLYRLTAKLTELTALSFEDLKKKGKDLDALRFFRGHIQAGLGLGNQIRAVRLAGRHR